MRALCEHFVNHGLANEHGFCLTREISMHRLAMTCAASVCAAAMMMLTGPARAANYNVTFVAGHGTQLPWIRLIKEFYIPEVDKRLKAAGSQHTITWTEAYGGTVAKIGGVLDALREGVAEMGYVYTIFEPAKLPLLSVSFMAPFGSDDPRLITQVMIELHQELPELADQWTNHKTVYLGTVAADTDYIVTTFPVTSLADLKGKKMGASGSLSLWMSGGGMVPVQGDFSTHFNNVKTGVYDGLVAFSTGIYPTKLHQVAPYATRIDLGSMSIGALAANKPFFDGLPSEVQKVLKEVGIEYSYKVADTVTNLAKVFEQKMAEEGAKFSRLPAEERKKWAMGMPNIGKNWVENNEGRGIAAGKVFAAYLQKLRDNKVDLVRQWDKE
jgi:TRAP-type C4-dicarboxylate transport system substrate-binding protein